MEITNMNKNNSNTKKMKQVNYPMSEVFVYTVVDAVINHQGAGGTSYRLLYLPFAEPDGGISDRDSAYRHVAECALDAHRIGIPFCLEADDQQLQTTGVGATVRVVFIRDAQGKWVAVNFK